jgi:hypothetical protein
MPKLSRRGLLRPTDLPPDGKDFTVISFSPSEGDFYANDLKLRDDSGKQYVLGLQKTSFNVDSLIDLLGDITEDWPDQRICLYPSDWKGIDVIRIRHCISNVVPKTRK